MVESLFDFPPEWDALIVEIVSKWGAYPEYRRCEDADQPLIVEEK